MDCAAGSVLDPDSRTVGSDLDIVVCLPDDAIGTTMCSGGGLACGFCSVFARNRRCHDVEARGRLAPTVESIVYFSIAELVTNAAKHAHASTVHVGLEVVPDGGGDVLRIQLRDNGGPAPRCAGSARLPLRPGYDLGGAEPAQGRTWGGTGRP